MAAPKITSDQGWSQLTYTLGHSMPRQLHAAAKARRSLTNLTKRIGKG